MSDDHDHEGEGHESSPVLQAKIALLCIIGFTTLASALTPWFASGFLATRKALDFIRVAAAASAGVVVGTMLCHLLPHASEAFSAYLSTVYEDGDAHGHEAEGARRLAGEVLATNAQRMAHYPWAHMICGAMLFALLIIDFAFAHGLGGHSHGSEAGSHRHGHGHGHGHSHDHVTGGVLALQEAKAAADGAATAVTAAVSPSMTTAAQTPAPVAIAVAPSPAAPAASGEAAAAASTMTSDVTTKSTIVEVAKGAAPVTLTDPTPAGTAQAPSSSSSGMASFELEMRAGLEADGAVDGDPDMQAPSTCGQGCASALGCSRTARSHKMALLVGQTAGSQRQLRVRAWVFALAMSIHAVFDGLGVGVQTSAGGFSSLIIAVFVHKLFDGLSLGSTVFLGDLPACQRWFLLIITSILTPIGIGIGIAVVETVATLALELATGIILSLSAGSFAFIGLIELLPSALADGRYIPLKLGVFGLGYLIMAIIAAWA